MKIFLTGLTALALVGTAAANAGALDDGFVIKTSGASETKAGARSADKGDLDLAERLTRRGLERAGSGPSQSVAWSNLCAIEARQGDLTEALAACDQAVARYDESDAAYRNRGVVKLKLGDAAGAAADFRASLALESDERTAALLAEAESAGAPSQIAAQ